MNITEVLVPAQPLAWLPWAVQYFFYIGSAYAASILFLGALLLRKHTSHALRSAVVLVMAIGSIVGPLALTADLHQPGRAWHFFFYLTPWSWMSRGSVLLPIFSLCSVLCAWFYLRSDLAKLKLSDNKIARFCGKLAFGDGQTSEKSMTIMAIIAAISGLSIALYTGMEISGVESRPLWHQPATPLLWVSSAFLGAVGFTLLVLCLLPKKQHSPLLNQSDRRLVGWFLTFGSVTSFILLPLWASTASVSLLSISGWSMNLGILMSGFAISFLLAYLIKNSNQPLNYAKLFIAAAVTLFTCWMLRWVTLMEVQTLPKYDVGPYPYHLPTDSTGLVGIIGMFGLWLALAALTSELVSTSKIHSSLSHTQKQRG